MSKHNIEQCVRDSLGMYFQDLDGSNPHDVYDMVISCVEKPLLEVVLEQAGGNQSLAAEYLGITAIRCARSCSSTGCCSVGARLFPLAFRFSS